MLSLSGSPLTSVLVACPVLTMMWSKVSNLFLNARLIP